jgi:hypothetical protein
VAAVAVLLVKSHRRVAELLHLLLRLLLFRSLAAWCCC